MHRVVITGIGAVTPLGNTFHDSWCAGLDSRSGIRSINKFDVCGLPWHAAGEVVGFNPLRYLSRKEALYNDLFVHYASAASAMAVANAGLLSDNYRASSGIIVGSSRGGISTMETALLRNHEAAHNNSKIRMSPHIMPATTISAAASFPAQKLGLKGHCLGISNACSSGANAIGEAYQLIKSGYQGPVLAGGTEAPLCRFCLQGYGSAGALSDFGPLDASRPFDRQRNGFVISEGACIMVLEQLENALNRAAEIYAEIIGYACNTDAFHITRPDSSGESDVIKAAMKSAAVSAEEIDYINAHGTSTVLGDRAEAAALHTVFRDRAGKIPVSALKSMTGHMLAASGALETAFTAMTLKTGIVPPTLNLVEKDEACDLNIIQEKTAASFNLALSQSFGFGGVNAVLVLKKYRP